MRKVIKTNMINKYSYLLDKILDEAYKFKNSKNDIIIIKSDLYSEFENKDITKTFNPNIIIYLELNYYYGIDLNNSNIIFSYKLYNKAIDLYKKLCKNVPELNHNLIKFSKRNNYDIYNKYSNYILYKPGYINYEYFIDKLKNTDLATRIGKSLAHF